MAKLNPYSDVSIQPKFNGLDELFRMSKSIVINNSNETTLSQIVAELNEKWKTENYKNERIAHLRQGLIEHITGLKQSMNAIFKDNTQLGNGQMLLFDTAYRKVTLNHVISITYKALGIATEKAESFEYLLINPRLVSVDNIDNSKGKPKGNSNNVMEIIRGYIKRITKDNKKDKTLNRQLTELGKIESIGITESGFYMVNPKPIKPLPAFDEDITIFMLDPFGDKDLPIDNTVSTGVNREKFHTDFKIGTIRSQRDTINSVILDKVKVNEEINKILKKRLDAHAHTPQIVKKCQIMDSLFHNKLNDVVKHLPIYQVLPSPIFPLIRKKEYENGVFTILRTIRFYLLFKWMELYYDFYDFCFKPIKPTHEAGKHTINDPLNRCANTLEFRMYKHQTELIKKSLLYVLYQLYDFKEVENDKQIYTPEMLVYDLGKIIEAHSIDTEAEKTQVAEKKGFGSSDPRRIAWGEKK